MNSPG